MNPIVPATYRHRCGSPLNFNKFTIFKLTKYVSIWRSNALFISFNIVKILFLFYLTATFYGSSWVYLVEFWGMLGYFGSFLNFLIPLFLNIFLLFSDSSVELSYFGLAIVEHEPFLDLYSILPSSMSIISLSKLTII